MSVHLEITVNGKGRPWTEGLSVAAVVEAEVRSTRGVAVAVDRSVIPRSAWGATLLDPGAAVEIVAAAAGG